MRIHACKNSGVGCWCALCECGLCEALTRVCAGPCSLLCRHCSAGPALCHGNVRSYECRMRAGRRLCDGPEAAGSGTWSMHAWTGSPKLAPLLAGQKTIRRPRAPAGCGSSRVKNVRELCWRVRFLEAHACAAALYDSFRARPLLCFARFSACQCVRRCDRRRDVLGKLAASCITN